MDYFDLVIELLKEVRETQRNAIEQAAQVMAEAIQNEHMVYAFGPTHAGILAQELFYRAGGLVPVNPILPPGLTTDVRPVTLTSQLERLPGFGARIIAETPIEQGDVLIVHSVSGRNAAVVDAAQSAKARGAFVIAVTSLEYSRAVQPRQPGMARLFEVADLVLDNRAPVGDALVALPGLPQRVGPSSTVIGAAMLNAVVARTAELLLQRTGDCPVFHSANLDGGDEHNRRWLEHYRGRLTYL
jgi:uncharacterized phosphosugar-binding protein